MILTGGVDITTKELEYVFDATLNGWDDQYGKYVDRFEHSFCEYIGSKHARSLTGGTQALLLSLDALEIGEGDEVIMPDLTYFACSDVVINLGARPVFVDVREDTWCIDVERIESAITPNTKAIMPVWLYGNAPEMDEITNIAKRHDIFVVEDACPAVGSLFNGLHAGTFGDFGCFSFHGAKIMTTGFGGMAVTDNEELDGRLHFLNDHGEDKTLPNRFWQTEVGHSCYMHNINAALGLAQLDRIEDFVLKKRQIFNWYHERLYDIEGLSMNHEQDKARTNRWLTSIVLKGKFKMDRDCLMKRLKEDGIDTRPFFYAISSFDIYEDANTPMSHSLGLNGINLPSGIQRTEDEVDFISKKIIKYLCG